MDLQTLNTTDSWTWPEEAGAFLISALRNADTPIEDALLAAELAGDFVVASDDMADTLMAVLMDGRRPSALREVAAVSLGPLLEAGSDAAADEFGLDEEDDVAISPEAVARLQQGLRALYEAADTPEILRRRVLEASARDPRDWHEAAVRSAYQNPAEASQVTALFCMGYVRGFDEEILHCLRHNNEDMRYYAVVAAGNGGLQEAWDEIVPILASESEDKSLRMAAIEAVAFIRPEETYEVLHPLLEHADQDLAAAAQEALMLAEATLDLDEEDDRRDDDDDDDEGPEDDDDADDDEDEEDDDAEKAGDADTDEDDDATKDEHRRNGQRRT